MKARIKVEKAKTSTAKRRKNDEKNRLKVAEKVAEKLAEKTQNRLHSAEECKYDMSDQPRCQIALRRAYVVVVGTEFRFTSEMVFVGNNSFINRTRSSKVQPSMQVRHGDQP